LKSRLYARDLLKKLITEKELRILEVVWDDELSDEQKIDELLGDSDC
jgi:hypothetical protein